MLSNQEALVPDLSPRGPVQGGGSRLEPYDRPAGQFVQLGREPF